MNGLLFRDLTFVSARDEVYKQSKSRYYQTATFAERATLRLGTNPIASLAQNASLQ
jgi:hypothetical protein